MLSTITYRFRRKTPAYLVAFRQFFSVMVMIPIIAIAGSQDKSGKNVNQVDVNQFYATGKQLKQAIDERYLYLKASKKLVTSGNGRNSLDDLISAFIVPGSQYDNAVLILQAAGFKLGAHEQSYTSPGELQQIAQIDEFVPTKFGKTSILVLLRPEKSTGWTIVGHVSGSIVIQLP